VGDMEFYTVPVSLRNREVVTVSKSALREKKEFVGIFPMVTVKCYTGSGYNTSLGEGGNFTGIGNVCYR
jgi:hypothetical protein